MTNEKNPDSEQWTPERRWEAMLDDYLNRSGIRLPQNPGVLNLGCGNNVKWNYLGVTGYLLKQGLGVPYYVGVDVKEESFAQAKKVMAGLVHFIAADARGLTRYLKGSFHLIIVEHPNLTTSPEGPRVWRQVFEEAAALLADEGALIVTSFWLNDHIPAQVVLGKAGYQLLFSGKNKYPGRLFDTLETGETLQTDKYILIAKKLKARSKP